MFLERKENYRIYLTVSLIMFALSILILQPPTSPFREISALIGMLLQASVILLWITSIRIRILNSFLRRYLISIAVLILFWMTLKNFKWHFIPDDTIVGRYCWYLYYFPILMIPTICLLITDCTGKSDIYRVNRRKYLWFLLSLVFFGFVLTNDLHRLVFDFPAGISKYDILYTYHFLYYLIYGWVGFLLLLVFIRIIYKSRVPGWKGIRIMPVILLLAGAGIYVSYSLNLKREFDLTMVECFIILIMLESAIHSGLLPSNSSYRVMFQKYTESAYITDSAYRICFQSDHAQEITKEDMIRAESEQVIIDGYLLNNETIAGGHMIWLSDISRIQNLQRRLRAANDRLSEINDLLKAELELREQMIRVEEKQRIYTQITSELEDKLRWMMQNTDPDQQKDDAEDPKRLLKQICVVGVYIKRYSNMLLLSQHTGKIEAQELYYCLRESTELLNLAGLKTGLGGVCRGEIDIEHACAFYEFFEVIAECELKQGRALLVNLNVQNGMLQAKINADAEHTFAIPDLHRLSLAGGDVQIHTREQDIMLNVRINA